MLFDTSAWIELFMGSAEGRRAAEILHRVNCYTSIVSLAEVANWALKQGKDPSQFIDTVNQLSDVLPIDRHITVIAGELSFKRKKANKKWGMLDSFVLATGHVYGLKILTKDSDFRDVEGVVLL